MGSEAQGEREFEIAADQELRDLESPLTEIDGIEADLESGILTIEFEDGVKYVINSHRAARQIWMAAEQNAWHFDRRANEKRWVAPKSGDELWTTVEGVLSRKLRRTITLPRV